MHSAFENRSLNQIVLPIFLNKIVPISLNIPEL